MLTAATNTGYLTFDGSTPSATNGLPIIAGQAPALLPLGYFAKGSGVTLKWASAIAGNAVLNVMQLR